MRGEYGTIPITPEHKRGTTSACAENTSQAPPPPPSPVNYLRMRGEYVVLRWWEEIWTELPPHARRIRLFRLLTGTWLGTTSACAENTSPVWFGQCRNRNYLRMRGEYWLSVRFFGGHSELPPHARRIRTRFDHFIRVKGTTSACVENTS